MTASGVKVGLTRCAALVLTLAGMAEVHAAPASANSLRALLRDGACSVDEQCHTVAEGHRAYGGPEFYLAWSSRAITPGQLNSALASYRTQAAAGGDGRVSICSVAVDPGAQCVEL